MNDRASCVVLVLDSLGSPLAECDERLRELENRGFKVWRIRGSASPDAAMSQTAAKALAGGFDELMWIGPNILFDPSDVDRLREHDLPIVSGLYCKTTDRSFAAAFLPNTGAMQFGKEGKLIEVRYAGFGFMLTRRPVFDAIVHQFRLPTCNEGAENSFAPYFMPMLVKDEAGGWRYLEADFAFCERARQSRLRVMADTRIRLWHVGNYPYTWEDTLHDPKRPPRPRSVNDQSAQPSASAVGNAGSPDRPEPNLQVRSRFRGEAVRLHAGFPHLRAYMMTYPANRESAELTRANIGQSDWGDELHVFEQPADWPAGKPSASRNYKRILEQALADRCDFALILEDDVRVCRNLRHNLITVPLVRRDQCDYLSLFMPDLISSPWERLEPHLGYRLARPLYSGPNRRWEKHRLFGSLGYLLSRRLIEALVERWDRLKEAQDTRVISVCAELKLPMWYTSPCWVEHAPLRSAFGTPITYAPDFDENFRLDLGEGFQPPEAIPGWLTIDEARLLWQTAIGKTVLELGTACGRSTVCLAQSACSVISIDVQEQTEAAEWLRRYGLSERVQFCRGDASEQCRGLDQRFDLVFVDTDHDAASIERDIEASLRLLEPGGLIAFHDYPDPGWPDVRKVVDQHAKKRGWKRTAQAGYLGVFCVAP